MYTEWAEAIFTNSITCVPRHWHLANKSIFLSVKYLWNTYENTYEMKNDIWYTYAGWARKTGQTPQYIMGSVLDHANPVPHISTEPYIYMPLVLQIK